MGIAHYNRGTALVRRAIDAETDEDKRHFFAVLDRLNRIPKDSQAGTPFGPVVIQFPEVRGGSWWLMRAGADRHSHFAYCYRTLPELMAAWRIVVTGTGRDGAGGYYTCDILPR